MSQRLNALLLPTENHTSSEPSHSNSPAPGLTISSPEKSKRENRAQKDSERNGEKLKNKTKEGRKKKEKETEDRESRTKNVNSTTQENPVTENKLEKSKKDRKNGEKLKGKSDPSKDASKKRRTTDNAEDPPLSGAENSGNSPSKKKAKGGTSAGPKVHSRSRSRSPLPPGGTSSENC